MKNVNDNYEYSTDYNFVDAIRCIAMMSIVAEHCLSAGGHSSFQYGSTLYWTYIPLVQFSKFGTISFFLLAGFLLSDKFTNYSSFEYFKRRLSNTFIPWLFWSLTYVLIDITLLFFKSNKHNDGSFNFHNIFNNIKGLYLLSNYWFIINFMISIGLLLMFKRYLYSLFLGLILFSFTLFYSINIYHEWIPSNHTVAIFGFVFFLWLGAQLRRHWDFIKNLLEQTPYIVVAVLLIITLDMAIYEIVILHKLGIETTNTLRFSNILYSLVFFILLLKIKNFKLINILKPRQTTYGIYLIHYILVVFLLPFLVRDIVIEALTALQFFILRLACFIVIYTTTYLMVVRLENSKAKKLIGN